MCSTWTPFIYLCLVVWIQSVWLNWHDSTQASKCCGNTELRNHQSLYCLFCIPSVRSFGLFRDHSKTLWLSWLRSMFMLKWHISGVCMCCNLYRNTSRTADVLFIDDLTAHFAMWPNNCLYKSGIWHLQKDFECASYCQMWTHPTRAVHLGFPTQVWRTVSGLNRAQRVQRRILVFKTGEREISAYNTLSSGYDQNKDFLYPYFGVQMTESQTCKYITKEQKSEIVGVWNLRFCSDDWRYLKPFSNPCIYFYFYLSLFIQASPVNISDLFFFSKEDWDQRQSIVHVFVSVDVCRSHAHLFVLQLNNRLFEELAMDVYDEVDRRENDAGYPSPLSLLWLSSVMLTVCIEYFKCLLSPALILWNGTWAGKKHVHKKRQ